jgi:hypothetical protein
MLAEDRHRHLQLKLSDISADDSIIRVVMLEIHGGDQPSEG